jgi:DNA-binding transcriptional ArsR family regulator
MPTARQAEITDPRQIEALASPVRQEIVDVVHATGACSAGEIAELLGRAQDGLYYHIRALLKVGLLREAGVRETARRDEILYDVPGRPLRLRYRPGDRRNAAAVTRTIRSMLRLAERNFARALGRDDLVVRGLSRNIWGGRFKGWLTPAELREVNKHLRAISEIAQGGGRRRGAALHEVTFVLSPVEASARRRGSKGDES